MARRIPLCPRINTNFYWMQLFGTLMKSEYILSSYYSFLRSRSALHICVKNKDCLQPSVGLE